MRKRALLAVGLMGLFAGAATSLARVPTVTVDWVGIHEISLCAAPQDTARFAAAQEEAERRLPEFQAAWAKHGPALLRETRAVVGERFTFRETMATLHVCESHAAGTSYPLTINLKWFLRTYAGRYHDHPRADELFANTVYHEVLHRYIRDITGRGIGQPMRPTPLMLRHANEPLFTRTHLHLIAVERLVYERLGKAEIPALMWADFRNPAYQRAYALANEVGMQAILADLRQAAAARRSGRPARQ